MNSRERILAALRANKPPFEAVPPRPAAYLPVTQTPGAADDLLTRFTAELERLNGKVYRAANAEAAIQQVLALVGEDRTVLAWDDLPLPSLVDALAQRHIERIVPQLPTDMPEARVAALQTLEPVRVGVTGAEAGLATTGTLVLTTGAGKARLASLLPLIHIALLPLDRLYPTMEAWLEAGGKQLIGPANNVTFVTGPSRTSDIEMQTILGVHGPREVHVIVFSSSPDIGPG